MHAPVESSLMTFNQLALHHQDEVFTLAYYLLGNESGAAEAAQTAFESVYRRSVKLSSSSFRFDALRSALLNCRRGKKFTFAQGRGGRQAGGRADEFCQKLMDLPQEEREAAILVDVLGLTYDESTQVLGFSSSQVKRLVAQARFHLGHGVEARQ